MLKACSSLPKLDPFIDDEGILRVKGRIQRSALANEMQNPVLLPKSCRIAELVVHWCHGVTSSCWLRCDNDPNNVLWFLVGKM